MCIFEVGLKYWSEIRNPGSATPATLPKQTLRISPQDPMNRKASGVLGGQSHSLDKGPYSLFMCLPLTAPFTPFPPSVPPMPLPFSDSDSLRFSLSALLFT